MVSVGLIMSLLPGGELNADKLGEMIGIARKFFSGMETIPDYVRESAENTFLALERWAGELKQKEIENGNE